MDHGAQCISEIQLYDKYARWLPDEQRRETWPEVVDRVLAFFASRPEWASLDSYTQESLKAALLAKDVLPSMRIVQMAGPALERCHVGAYNCAFLGLDSPEALGELLYILMQGTGVGYSVERQYVSQWPAVERDETPLSTPVRPVVPDSTEGWCESLVSQIRCAILGVKVNWDFSQIRPEGTWLHTKGGRASGPEPLRDLFAKTWDIIRDRAGRRLTAFDVHRLATLCGSIVQVGGVRRAAEIALFDADDAEMAHCKQAGFWNRYPELAMANNSMVFTEDPSADDIAAFMDTVKANGTGEPGIFRRNAAVPERRTPATWGTNPCGEIILRSRQFCNLSIAVARPTDNYGMLVRKVRLATILGTLQSTLTDFRYLSPQWAEHCNEERLLGVDITGTLDCTLLQPSPQLPSVLRALRQEAVYTNAYWADQMGIPRSAAITCNKPSGNSSQLLNASSGIHPRYAPYYVRRLRLGARSPLALHLQALGLPMFPEVGQGTLDEARVWVVELPVKSPERAYVRHQLPATQQLDYWLCWKLHWTEHNPSCTIYVENHEWPDVTAFLTQHWTKIGGLSFLPKDGGVYALAPYEEITHADYEARLAQLPASLQLDTIRETLDLTTVAQDYACVSGVCEL